MEKKALIIISTGEREKALTGILYATNALKNKWLDDVKVILFGPFEKIVAEDPDLQQHLSAILAYQTPVACKFIADRDEISTSLKDLGVQLEYVGAMISEYIGEGYVPMVF